MKLSDFGPFYRPTYEDLFKVVLAKVIVDVPMIMNIC